MLRAKIINLGKLASYHLGLSALLARRQEEPKILMFHGVGDRDLPPEVFSAQMEFLARSCAVLSLDELLEEGPRKERPLRPEVVLTFDDGLRNNYTVAYPILQRLKLPATFYVCPALCESGAWLWTHESRERLRLLSQTERVKLRRALRAPEQAEDIVEWMKTLPLQERLSAEAVIRFLTPEFRPSPTQRHSFDVMSWRELRALDPALITIGSHTLDHPILSSLTPAEAEHQIAESRRWLEAELSRPVEHFSYPNGTFDEVVLESARRHYRSATAAEPLEAPGGELDLHCLPRVPAPEDLPSLPLRLGRARGGAPNQSQRARLMAPRREPAGVEIEIEPAPRAPARLTG